MPAIFSLNLSPSVTRDNISIKHTAVTLDVEYNVTKDFDIQTTANANFDAVVSKTTSIHLQKFNSISLSCDAVATKRLIQFLPALTDIISDNGAIRRAISNQTVTSNISFLGGRLIDNIVNARYNNVGYVLEGYAADEPASKAFAELRIESDITILLSVDVVSTLSVSITVDYNPSIQLNTEFNLACSVTGVALIELDAFGNSNLAVEFVRYREHEANILSQSTLFADAEFTVDNIQLVVSEATLNADIAKILGGIIVGDLPAAFTLECIGDDLILEETQVFVEVQSTLRALPGNRYFGEINLVANAGVVNVFTVEHIDEYVYIIPAEGWEYKIEAESRNHKVIGESRLRKITAESGERKIAAESRTQTIT